MRTLCPICYNKANSLGDKYLKRTNKTSVEKSCISKNIEKSCFDQFMDSLMLEFNTNKIKNMICKCCLCGTQFHKFSECTSDHGFGFMHMCEPCKDKNIVKGDK